MRNGLRGARIVIVARSSADCSITRGCGVWTGASTCVGVGVSFTPGHSNGAALLLRAGGLGDGRAALDRRRLAVRARRRLLLLYDDRLGELFDLVHRLPDPGHEVDRRLARDAVLRLTQVARPGPQAHH